MIGRTAPDALRGRLTYSTVDVCIADRLSVTVNDPGSALMIVAASCSAKRLYPSSFM